MSRSRPNDSRAAVTEEQVARVFRILADEHAEQCARAAEERTWGRLQHKMALREGRRWSLLPAARAWLAAAAVAASVALALWWWSAPPDELRYEVHGGHLIEGWIYAGDQRHARLAFSDGSHVDLSKHSAINVSVVGKHSALTRLSHGQLRAKVVHAEDTDWRFFAGPFEVRVLGTEFDLTWNDNTLSLQMHSGQVRVEGPEQRSWTVQAGEHFEMSALDVSRADSERPAAPPHESTEHPETVPPNPTRVEPAPAEAPSVVARPAPAPPRASWSHLLARGDFAKLLEEARSAGLESVLSQRSAGDLVALAQAARYSKELVLAERTWQTVRARFTGSQAAHDAAFYLGRIAEQRGHVPAALRWYGSYLGERSGGAYAAEAMGRRLVILHKRNDALARDEAGRYLAHFPNGPYAKLAQDIVGGSP